tara:strand:+ start:2407 stop:2679 length:273 start_codon:yes stop_codon:yes gene_type:complete
MTVNTCASCKTDGLDAEEIADTTGPYKSRFIGEMVAHWGGKVCNDCADNAVACDGCGEFLPDPIHGQIRCDVCEEEPIYGADEMFGFEQI